MMHEISDIATAPGVSWRAGSLKFSASICGAALKC
jgi:hypothetical protein